MPFKINISEKGKTYHFETESESFISLKLGDKIKGNELKPELEGYELEIKGASDKAGFPSFKEVEGTGLKRVLLTYGKGMHKKPKGERKTSTRPKGLRLRKTVRGNTISKDVVQINLSVIKPGSKKLEEIFPEQGKKKEEKPEEKLTAEQPKPEPEN